MRRIILLSTVLLATPFGMESYAADCATTSCQELGYTATSNKGNCLQCPFGNYWFCPESQCDSSYKYTCTGYMQSPSGTACDGKYQKCNCSNNYVWNASQGLCLACTSMCTGYTLTYKQAVQQCGSSNAFACLDNCTGNRMYKCGTNTGSGSDSGSDSGSGSGSESCTCPDGYKSYKTSGCNKTKTSTCGTTCYQGATSYTIYRRTCKNTYCSTTNVGYLLGDCVYERRATHNDSWVVEKTVNDDLLNRIYSACSSGSGQIPVTFTQDYETESVCND